MLLSLLKVSGHSMEPEIKNSSFFISSSIPYFLSQPKIGDKIIFKNKDKIIVKKIHKKENGKYLIMGVNLSDSFSFNPIKRNEILGKVVWIF